jgi:hypothetical protein
MYERLPSRRCNGRSLALRVRVVWWRDAQAVLTLTLPTAITSSDHHTSTDWEPEPTTADPNTPRYVVTDDDLLVAVPTATFRHKCAAPASAPAIELNTTYNPLFRFPAEVEQQSVATRQTKRGWAPPPCRHFKNQSCCCLALFSRANPNPLPTASL